VETLVLIYIIFLSINNIKMKSEPGFRKWSLRVKRSSLAFWGIATPACRNAELLLATVGRHFGVQACTFLVLAMTWWQEGFLVPFRYLPERTPSSINKGATRITKIPPVRSERLQSSLGDVLSEFNVGYLRMDSKGKRLYNSACKH
jgi:hypothetical protein